MRFIHKQEVKSDPRSDIITEGTLCNRMTSHVMIFDNSPAVMSERQDI